MKQLAFEKFTVSDGFDLEITQDQNRTKVLLLDMSTWLQKLQAEFPGVKLKLNTRLEQLDLTYSLPGLAEAPFPAMGDLDTRAERSTALLQQWRTYASIGLRLLISQKGNFWRTAGTLPLQNHGAENWQPLLQPFLTTTNEIFLLSNQARLSVEIIDLGSGLLRSGDRLTIRGGFLVEVTAWEQKQEIIQQRRNLAFNLNEGIPVQIAPWNNNRKYIYLTNVGSNPIHFIFGTAIELLANATYNNGALVETSGLLLSPNGSASFVNSHYVEPAPVTAVAIRGNGRISVLEGW